MDRPQFSDILAERRRQLGFSIGQASRVLRLKEDVLVAFEEGDFSRMPKSGYAQGMLSSYARYLGLDAAELCEIYLKDYERYRHGEARRPRRGEAGRPTSPSMGAHEGYVAPRGLLPTSGGYAGDLNSFATTRVRSRGAEPYGQAYDDEREEEPTQVRPYTGRVPSRTRRSSRSGSSRSRGDIQTMRYNRDEYEDDLRIGREARSFESASTRRGRSSSRNIGNTQRPRVQRGGERGRSSTGRAGSRQQRPILEQLFGDSSQLVVLVVVGVILILSIVLVLSIGSCVRHNTDSARTVPVADASAVQEPTDAAAQSQDSQPAGDTGTASTTAAGDASADPANPTATDATGAQGGAASTSKQQETSVSVSVADGAVAWLEVECDGKSDVADTITGPWQRTYTVEDALSVQTNNTTSVTVVQNGRQLQFDSMASGIGTLRVQGSGTKSKSAGKSKGATGDDGSSNSAKTGNASQGQDGTSEGASEGTDQQDDASSAGSDGTGAEQTIIEYDYYGNPIYGYDEYGNPIYGYDEYGNPIY